MWMPGGGGPPGIMLIAWSMPIPGGMGGMGIGGMGGIPGTWRGEWDNIMVKMLSQDDIKTDAQHLRK